MELDLHGQIKKRKGWQKVILLTIQGYFDNKVGRNAAGMTYYLLFAMFPFFIFVTSLLGLLHLPTLTFDGQITRFLPDGCRSCTRRRSTTRCPWSSRP